MSVTSFTIQSDTRLTNLSYITGTFTLDDSYPATELGYPVGLIDGGIVFFWGYIIGQVATVRYDLAHQTIRVYDAAGVEYADDVSTADGWVIQFFAIRSTFAP